MATADVAWLRERSPILLAAAAIVNTVCAVVVGLEGFWLGAVMLGVVAALFAVAAIRFARNRRRGPP